jgi:hypothetical protein
VSRPPAYCLRQRSARVSNHAARWKGYRKALQVHGLRYVSELTVEGDYRTESGYRAGLLLLHRRPDAVFVANYLMTVGLMQAADEMGMSCPEDYALASFDNYPWLRCFRPRLTSIELCKYELGARSTEMLLNRISGKKGNVLIQKLAQQLRVRESCGFARNIRHSNRRNSNREVAISNSRNKRDSNPPTSLKNGDAETVTPSRPKSTESSETGRTMIRPRPTCNSKSRRQALPYQVVLNTSMAGAYRSPARMSFSMLSTD